MNGQVYIPGPDERLDLNLLARTRQQESETTALDAILSSAIAAVRALNPPAGWPSNEHDQASTIDALEQLRPNRTVEIEDDVTAAERAFDERQQGNDARRGWRWLSRPALLFARCAASSRLCGGSFIPTRP